MTMILKNWPPPKLKVLGIFLYIWVQCFDCIIGQGEAIDKAALKQKAHEMFMHGYNAYMQKAFPADELMPISCKPRIRGVTPSRGDVDDSLGNFSLTLVDSLDTLIIVGEYDEFERAVSAVVENVRFDSDFVVSVFETNIRMVGGLISGHLMAVLLKNEHPEHLKWYHGQLLKMAEDLAERLLPAFNTTSGVPHPRINLKHGITKNLKHQVDTCTACGGTMILEFSALSRLTGKPIFEEKAKKAMDFLWHQRNRGSDLMGTVLNIENGDWIRRDAGIGAGIDSYYEYLLKAYILLGEEDYLYRFNKHYDAVMRYLNKGPMFVDVHMHKPNVASRPFMDSLLAFWPGLQVLKGDLRSAIEMHEMLYHVVKKHKFLPEAFTHDFQVHWAQHPLRPEFIESTYVLYRATKDPYYLEVMDSLEENVRVPCGFAAVKDVRTMEHMDQMDSFVLAETFKYLYMIFAEPNDLLFDPDNYVLTTEAHFLPLSIGETSEDKLPRRMLIDPDEIIDGESELKYKSACPNFASEYRSPDELSHFGHSIRADVQKLLGHMGSSGGPQVKNFNDPGICAKVNDRLRAWSFSASNSDHLDQLRKMGIDIEIQADGRIQLTHTSNNLDPSAMPQIFPPFVACYWDEPLPMAKRLLHSSKAMILNMSGFVMVVLVVWLTLMLSAIVAFVIGGIAYRTAVIVTGVDPLKERRLRRQEDALNSMFANLGLEFMQEMVSLAAQRENEPIARVERIVQIISEPHFGTLHFIASPAQFGLDLNNTFVEAELVLAQPYISCSPLENTHETRGRLVVVQRGNCMFQDKARYAQDAGAIGVIVADNQIGSSADHSPVFAMSADNNKPDDIEIPVVFLFHKESQKLLNQKMKYATMKVRLGEKVANPGWLFENFLKYGDYARRAPEAMANAMIALDSSQEVLRLNFRFAHVNAKSSAEDKQMIVETNMQDLTKFVAFPTAQDMARFLNHARRLAYSLLGYAMMNSLEDMENLKSLLPKMSLLYPQKHQILTLDLDPQEDMLHKTSSMICNLRTGKKYSCYPL